MRRGTGTGRDEREGGERRERDGEREAKREAIG